MDAKQRLSEDAFVKLDRREATQLVGDPAELFADGNYYWLGLQPTISMKNTPS